MNQFRRRDPALQKRLLIALNDLNESRRFIHAYVAFADTPAYSEAYGALGMEMARRMENALLSCGLIAYARPFVQSRGGGWTKVPNRFTSSFSREERLIHKYVLEARQKLIAHSDLEGVHVHEVGTGDGGRVRSIRPVPIVMIPGEDDSLDVGLATARNEMVAQGTLDHLLDHLRRQPSQGEPLKLLIMEERLFEVSTEFCTTLVGMIEKVFGAIQDELDTGVGRSE